MSDEVKQKAFQPFYTTKKSGSGLGLASVAGFASQSGGIAYIDESQIGGSTIRILLPLSADRAPETSSKHVALKEANILLVDDDPLYRDAVTTFFSDQGIKLRTCKDTETALEIIDAQTIDLLITDLRMPGTSGLALAEQIAARQRSIPIVFLSGYVGDVDVSQTPSRAAISKNAPMSVILDQAASVLEKSKTWSLDTS